MTRLSKQPEGIRLNVFWLAPLVLPFCLATLVMALVSFVGAEWTNDDLVFLAVMSLLVGTGGGTFIAIVAMNEGFGWITIPTKSGEGE